MKKSNKVISIIVIGSSITAVVVVAFIFYANIINKQNEKEWERFIELNEQVKQVTEMLKHKKWEGAIDLADRLKSEGHADNRVLQAVELDLAEAYFHEKRYEEAAKACLIFLNFIEKEKESAELAYFASLRRAKYLSFVYAKTGDPQSKLATENQVRDSLKRTPSYDTPYRNAYARYGPIKYRLETRQLLTDEEYFKKDKKELSTNPYHLQEIEEDVTYWLTLIAPYKFSVKR